MARFLCPFLITDIKQIPDKLLSKYNLGLEAICFEGKLLNSLNFIAKQIEKINNTYSNKLVSFHFPTENANYLENSKIRNQLFKIIDLCQKNNISKIIIHSNYFERSTKFDFTKLPAIRKKFIDIFKKIDAEIIDDNFTLLIENMPIIGNNGDDFDSVFVFPNDFSAFKEFKNIKINWDFGHWAFTMKLIEEIKKLSPVTADLKAHFSDFKNVFSEIEHCHLSSFNGLTFPMTRGVCFEGVPPQLGNYSPTELEAAIRWVNTQKPYIQISLEITEQNYYNRKNLKRTLAWLRTKNLI